LLLRFAPQQSSLLARLEIAKAPSFRRRFFLHARPLKSFAFSARSCKKKKHRFAVLLLLSSVARTEVYQSFDSGPSRMFKTFGNLPYIGFKLSLKIY
jgi:hypothetical protein